MNQTIEIQTHTKARWQELTFNKNQMKQTMERIQDYCRNENYQPNLEQTWHHQQQTRSYGPNEYTNYTNNQKHENDTRRKR